MAKTKPIGVRFDEDVLKKVKENEKLETPQQALSFYEKEYEKALNEILEQPEVKKEIKKAVDDLMDLGAAKLPSFIDPKMVCLENPKTSTVTLGKEHSGKTQNKPNTDTEVKNKVPANPKEEKKQQEPKENELTAFQIYQRKKLGIK